MKIFIFSGFRIVVLVQILMEFLLFAAPRNFHRLPLSAAFKIRRIYFTYDIQVPSFDETMSRPDPELIYLLRPGEHFLSNREYEHGLSVNSAGLRDDEDSLLSPGIVVLGDSVAMGMGVGDNENYARILEDRGFGKVLNAGVVSFETVRELKLLARLDRSRLKTVILQYCINDYKRNHWYLRGDAEKISAEHEGGLNYYRKIRRFPFNLWAARLLLFPMDRHSQGSSRRGTTLILLEALEKYFPADAARRARILVFPACNFQTFDRAALAKDLERKDRAAFLKRVDFFEVDLSAAGLSYPIDGHPTAAGHQKIAEALMDLLSKNDGK